MGDGSAGLEWSGDSLASGHIPAVDFVGSQENRLAVRAECHCGSPELTLISYQFTDKFAGGRVPQPGRAVGGVGHNGLAVRAEGHIMHDGLAKLVQQRLTE